MGVILHTPTSVDSGWFCITGMATCLSDFCSSFFYLELLGHGMALWSHSAYDTAGAQGFLD